MYSLPSIYVLLLGHFKYIASRSPNYIGGFCKLHKLEKVKQKEKKTSQHS